ncbi:MAG: hypothetical protein QM608_07830 [Caulobacter sp.]
MASLGAGSNLPAWLERSRPSKTREPGRSTSRSSPWGHCFELEPGDRLTLAYDAVARGDALEVEVVNERELNLSPNGAIDDLQVLFNGGSSEGRSWNFKHMRASGPPKSGS